MAVQAAGVATLLDVLSTMDPTGKQFEIAEVLTQQNELLMDMTWREGNTITGHRDAVRTSLPTPSFRAINEGVPVTKSGSTPIEETCALLEDFSRVDRELAIMAGDVRAYRLQEAKPHLVGMAHKMATTVFYGNANTNPKEFTGLAPRYNTVNTATSNTATNVIDAGGVGAANRSIWLVKWDPDAITGLYPKNTKGGLDHEDATNASGQGAHGFPAAAALADASGNKFMGYEDHWIWRCGLMVKDWRYAVRIANIDPTLLTLTAATGPNLQDLMTQALELIEDSAGAIFYVPRALRAYFRRQLLTQKGAFMTWDEIGGKRVMSFGEAPIRRTDALNTNEARVV